MRHGSFRASNDVRDISEYPEVKIVKDPEIWKFVEQVLPYKAIPALTPKDEYPTTWQPPKGTSNDCPYFVRRTKNHMVPVYMERTFRGQRRVTVIRKIQGDIWTLEKEVQKLVLQKTKRYSSRVNEMSGQLEVHGDHVLEIRNYLMEKGF